MKIYTRSGDDGTTGLYRGPRVRKDDPRVDCYGTVDELAATLGLAGAVAGDQPLAQDLRQIQNELLVIGGLLSTPDDQARAAIPQMHDQWITRLEQQIDRADAQLPPLKTFILAGGTELAARLHLARAVCRRAERRLVTFSAAAPLPPLMIPYFNRLADWLFVIARAANRRAGLPDVTWNKQA